MSAVTVRLLSEGDMDSACRVLGLAFADNPSTLVNARGDRSRAMRTMERAVRIVKLGSRYSHALVATQDEEVVGVLNGTEWPHCQLGAGEKLATAPAMMRVMGSSLPRSLKMLSARARRDPRRAHWHIGPVGVHPGCQGRGVGKALLASFLETVDTRRSAAFLETDVDRNVLLYEKFGFEVTARQDIMGVDTRFMWREARSGDRR